MGVTLDQGPMDGPDQIGPDYSPKRTPKEHLSHIVKAFTTKQGLIGDYDYGKNTPPIFFSLQAILPKRRKTLPLPKNSKKQLF